MRINLARNWFAPSGERLRKDRNPHDVPATWKAQLPTGTEVLEEPVVEIAPVESKGKQKELPL